MGSSQISVQFWERVSSVQLHEVYIFFSSVLFFLRVSISHDKVEELWPSLFHEDYVSCLIIS